MLRHLLQLVRLCNQWWALKRLEALLGIFLTGTVCLLIVVLLAYGFLSLFRLMETQ